MKPEGDPAALSVRVGEKAMVPHALARLVDAGIELADFSLSQPTLDEVFLSLTGKSADVAQESVNDGQEEVAVA